MDIYFLFTEDNRASKPAGLYILSAFIFFIIAEKLVTIANAETSAIPEQQNDKISSKVEAEENEMDNNNCIVMTNNKRNDFVKECLKNKAEVIYLVLFKIIIILL